MTGKTPIAKWTNSQLLLGTILIAAGVLFLLGELFNLRLGEWTWPLLILLPGLLALLIGLNTTESNTGTGLSIAGSIGTCLGALMFAQNLTGLWASWAYAWALVAPTGVGLGMYLYGWRHPDHAQLRHDGSAVIRVGLLLFAAGFFFFEGILGLSGQRLGSAGWGVLLIVLGGLLLLRNIRLRRRA